MARQIKAGNARLESPTRRSRRMDDRSVTENRVLSDQERLDEFRKSFHESVLPRVPDVPGYHLIWLTTTNQADPIARRMRLGYEPVRADEIPGWEYASLKTGEYEGCIGVNEMVLFKLPIHLYERYMRVVHHEQPLEEEEKLTAALRVAEEEAARSAKSGRKGIKLEVEEGLEELGEDLEPPPFTETMGG